MRDVRAVATAVLLSAVMFHSCTCEKETPPLPAASFKGLTPGFKASSPNTPAPKAPTATAVAAEPTATPGTELPTPVAAVPQDFPVPVPEGASVTKVQGLANNASNVIFRSTAQTAELYNFYQDKLTRQFQRGGHAFASFKKGDLVANVTVTEDPKNPGQRVLAVMYEHEKPLDFDDF